MTSAATVEAFDFRKHPELGSPRADRYATLTEALEGAALSDNGVTLVGHDDREERRSYAEILDGARRRAAGLRAKGLQPCERVIIVLNTSFEFIETLFGVMLAGGVPVPAYPPLAMSRMDSYQQLLAHVARVTSARFLVTDRTIGALLGVVLARCPQLEELITASRLDGDPEIFPPVQPDGDTPGLVQCTSGSTSAPKAVVLLQRNLMANIQGMGRAFDLHDDDVMVSWVPLYHDMGLIGGLFSAISQALPLVLLPPDLFIMDTGAWWRAVDRHRGTITAGPNFAYALSVRRMDDEELADLDLSSVRIALCGAEPILPETAKRFTEALGTAGFPAGAFFPAYGLAESCVGVTMSRPGDGLHLDHVSREAISDRRAPRAEPAIGTGSMACVSVGRAIPGSEVVVRGNDGQRLPERQVGEVWTRGPSVMFGYLGNPGATAEAIHDGWLRTGDLGYLVGEELYLVGRVKNMLIVRGRNYYAEDIEAAVETVRGVRKGNAVAYGCFNERRAEEQLHVAVETRLRDDEARATLQETIREAVGEATGLAPAEVVLLAPGTLPKTTSGKKRRQATGRQVQDGTIQRKRPGAITSAAGILIKSQLGHLWHLLNRPVF